MRVPLTIVPFVDPRSTTTKFWRFGRISAWRRLTLLSLSGIVHSDRRPTVTGASLERDPLARRQDQRGGTGGLAVGGLAQRGEDLEATGLLRLVDGKLDLDRSEEVVALAAGVLTSRLDELGLQHVGDLAEALEVLRRQLHDEVVGNDPATLDVDGALVVHLAHQPSTQLDRADVGS